MSKLIIILVALAAIPAAWAEPALYKSVPLPDVDHLLVTGNMDVTYIQEQEARVEIYLRESSNSEIKLGIEESEKEGTRLVIKEQLPDQFSHSGKVVVAKVNVYLPQLPRVSLYSTQHFSASNINQDKFQLWIRDDSTVALANIDVTNFYIKLFDGVSATVEGLTTVKGTLSQYHDSYLHVENAEVNKLNTYNRSDSVLTIQNTQGKDFKSSVRNDGQVTLSLNSFFTSASMTVRHRGKLFSEHATFDFVTLAAQSNAKVKLGKSKFLTISAKNNAEISYLPTDKKDITRTDGVKIVELMPVTMNTQNTEKDTGEPKAEGGASYE